MNPIKFEGAQIIGKPKNWDDAKDGECVGLPAMVTRLPDGMAMFTSIWKPTDEERTAIARGDNVAITCFSAQVPIMLTSTDVDGEIVPFGAAADEAPNSSD